MKAELSRLPLFRELSEREKQLIEGAVSRKQAEVDQVIIRQGERTKAVHFVLDGLAAASRSLADGSRQITAILLPGDDCDLDSCLGQQSVYTVKALTTCRLASISCADVLAWLESEPRIVKALLRATMLRKALISEWLVSAGQRSGLGRLAHLICELDCRFRAAGLATNGHLSLPLNRADIGQILGLSLVHTNRMLQQLKGLEIISVRRHAITIKDFERLKQIANFDSDYLCYERPDTITDPPFIPNVAMAATRFDGVC